MNRLSSSAPRPRPTAFRKTSSPSVVTSGPNSSAATTTAMVSRLRRRMNPPALTASPLTFGTSFLTCIDASFPLLTHAGLQVAGCGPVGGYPDAHVELSYPRWIGLQAGRVARGLLPVQCVQLPASLAVPAVRASVAHPRPREGIPAAADLERQPERVEDVALGVSQGAEAGPWVEDHAVADHLPFALLIPTNLPVHVCYLLAESHAVAVESVLPFRRHTQSDHETNAGRRRGEKDAARPRVTSRESTQESCCYLGDEEDAARPRVNSEERTQGELL